jgi:hypothetical protein
LVGFWWWCCFWGGHTWAWTQGLTLLSRHSTTWAIPPAQKCCVTNYPKTSILESLILPKDLQLVHGLMGRLSSAPRRVSEGCLAEAARSTSKMVPSHAGCYLAQLAWGQKPWFSTDRTHHRLLELPYNMAARP